MIQRLPERELEEWIGATPDTPVPDRVKIRVYRRHHGICYIAKRPIRPGEKWDVEHVIAIINGGMNRESNLAPALRDKHKKKTADDLAEKAKTYRARKFNLGIKKDRTIRSWRKFDGTPVYAGAKR